MARHCTLASTRTRGAAWNNGFVASSITTRNKRRDPSAQAGATRQGDPTRQLLRHIMVVGGTLRDWDDLGDERWDDRVDRLGAVADRAGASFLTLRAFEPGAEPVDLYAPADGEPDLIVVLGESTRLPPSLVWELAYSELVFHPMRWDELSPDDLVEAIADFAHRQRRFGGLDDDS